jgi:hypothetical protein
MVSAPIVQLYYTQFIGDAVTVPTIKATAGFTGIALIDSDPYADGGISWYTNQNNFFRQVRNFIIDTTLMPVGAGAGIHWQVAQATSLQNIVSVNLLPSQQQQMSSLVSDFNLGLISHGCALYDQTSRSDQLLTLSSQVFNMRTDGGTANAQQGIFMDNGSGG